MNAKRILLLAALLPFSTALLAQDALKTDEIKYTEWDAWNSMKDGSWTKVEMISKFEGKETKMVTTTTRVKLENDILTIEAVTDLNGMKLPATKRHRYAGHCARLFLPLAFYIFRRL